MPVTAIVVFCIFFLVVIFAGIWSAKWRLPKSEEGLHTLDEWGLGGRSFGTVIAWFLIGGDLYTAYTVIAVPAALYGSGALGFFAVPYCVLVYPYMLLVMPRLWHVCKRKGYVTFADFVKGRFNLRWLTLAVAVTGILALMPYIALQLVGMRAVLEGLGMHGEIPLIIAFGILAFFTYSTGLRAPAMIAIVKDVMLYITVLAAIIVLPIKLGGYGHIFSLADAALKLHKPAASIMLAPKQYSAYATLALGSTLALMLYPHTATAVLSSKSADTVRRNAALLPSYSVLLVFIALLGFEALAAGVVTKDPNAAVPLLLMKMYPQWFSGFCMAAIAIGALVPAAIMSIAASNLFTRNLYGEFARKRPTPRQETAMAKTVSLVVKLGALLFVLYLPTAYAIEMQLLGGIWIAQLFPAVIIGAFTRRLHPWALLAGWAAGMASGTAMAVAVGMKSVYPVRICGHVWPMYAAVPAVLLNLAVAALLTLLLTACRVSPGLDATVAEDYA
ncbi:MAG TPA: sodium:solute symporter [Acidobacteriaceae bacterium]|nr:sodium:solute symporter [Acidobacteriaceae bacterium]